MNDYPSAVPGHVAGVGQASLGRCVPISFYAVGAQAQVARATAPARQGNTSGEWCQESCIGRAGPPVL